MQGKVICFQSTRVIISGHNESDAPLLSAPREPFFNENKAGNNSGALLLTIGRFTIAERGAA